MSNLNTNFNPKSGEYGDTTPTVAENTSDMGAPGGTSGINCEGWARAILTMDCIGGTSILYQVYMKHAGAATWHINSTVGDVTVAAGASTYKVVDCAGWGRIYIRAKTFTGGGATAGAWITLSNDRP